MSSHQPGNRQDIQGYYAMGGEHDRLSRGVSRLEMERTQEILPRYLPDPPAVILDIGGGPGAYARWLTGLGYQVHLIDPVPLHVEQALDAGNENAPPASARVGDARALDMPADSADLALLLGPLYHLTERTDRLQALAEARRVVRPDGLVVVAVISRFASLFDGFASGLYDDPAFQQIVEQDLATGQHRNPTGRPGYFTTAYFHRPDELLDELREAGLTPVDLVGIEGPGAWMTRDFDAWWDDPARRERLLFAARAVEREQALLGLSAHLLAVARVP